LKFNIQIILSSNWFYLRLLYKNNIDQKMERDLNYENNNLIQYEDYNKIKCKNYIVCGETIPIWWFDCKSCYICTNCLISGWGEFKFIDNNECPICLEITNTVVQKQCVHCLCVDCFKKTYFVDENLNNEPKFPYSSIENEYYENQDDEKWANNPLIIKYNQDWNNWDNNRTNKFYNNPCLRKCPVCRKTLT